MRYFLSGIYCILSEDRYPRRVFCQDWDAKPSRARQKKVSTNLLPRLVANHCTEWLDEIEKGDSAMVE